MSEHKGRAGSGEAREIDSSRIDVTRADVETLVRVANYYHKSLGPLRYIILITASSEVRAKYRFVAEESTWLKRFAKSTLEDMDAGGQSQTSIALTPRSLVAFWGRLLSSLKSRRSRRRLSAAEVERREALLEKVERSVRWLHQIHPSILEAELATRRPMEAEWMRARLEEEDSAAQ